MPSRLHHLLPLLKITPTCALRVPSRNADERAESALADYRAFVREAIPSDPGALAAYDERLARLIYRINAAFDESLLPSDQTYPVSYTHLTLPTILRV